MADRRLLTGVRVRKNVNSATQLNYKHATIGTFAGYDDDAD
jgi:hypothetical protein